MTIDRFPAFGDLAVRIVEAHLDVPWTPGVERLGFVVVDAVSEDGVPACGFTWTTNVGTEAIATLIERDLIPHVRARGGRFDWHAAADHLRDLGSGGLVSSALAAIDIACWDASARSLRSSLRVQLGGAQRVATYASGINWHFSDDELAAQVERLVVAGASAVKVKVGAPRTLADDVRRVARVRSILGPRRRLMIDANQRWSAEQARRAIDDLARFEPSWIEEPVAVDDFAALESVATTTTVPIATGENFHRRDEFRRAAEAGVGVLQPSVTRVGGITPFRDIVAMATAADVTIVPHLLPELSAQLVDSSGGLIEVPDGATLAALGVLAGPVPCRFAGDVAFVDDLPGHGLTFVGADDARRPTTASRGAS